MTQIVRMDTAALNRALIGFDRMFSDFERRFSNQIQNNYPPHNVIRTGENDYVLEIAVTGFSKDEITVEVDQDELIIKAQSKKVEPENIEYIHRGLASRDIEKRFALAEHMEIGDATVADGLLRVYIKRIVPEALKPRIIPIK